MLIFAAALSRSLLFADVRHLIRLIMSGVVDLSQVLSSFTDVVRYSSMFLSFPDVRQVSPVIYRRCSSMFVDACQVSLMFFNARQS